MLVRAALVIVIAVFSSVPFYQNSTPYSPIFLFIDSYVQFSILQAMLS